MSATAARIPARDLLTPDAFRDEHDRWHNIAISPVTRTPRTQMGLEAVCCRKVRKSSARADHSNSVPLAKHRHYTLNQPIYLQTHSGPARKPNRFVLSRRLPYGMTGSTICDAMAGEQYTRWVAVT